MFTTYADRFDHVGDTIYRRVSQGERVWWAWGRVVWRNGDALAVDRWEW